MLIMSAHMLSLSKTQQKHVLLTNPWDNAIKYSLLAVGTGIYLKKSIDNFSLDSHPSPRVIIGSGVATFAFASLGIFYSLVGTYQFWKYGRDKKTQENK